MISSVWGLVSGPVARTHPDVLRRGSFLPAAFKVSHFFFCMTCFYAPKLRFEPLPKIWARFFTTGSNQDQNLVTFFSVFGECVASNLQLRSGAEDQQCLDKHLCPRHFLQYDNYVQMRQERFRYRTRSGTQICITFEFPGFNACQAQYSFNIVSIARRHLNKKRENERERNREREREQQKEKEKYEGSG